MHILPTMIFEVADKLIVAVFVRNLLDYVGINIFVRPLSRIAGICSLMLLVIELTTFRTRSMP